MIHALGGVSAVTIFAEKASGHAWPGHPERPARIDALRSGLERASIGLLDHAAAPTAAAAQIERVHDAAWLDTLAALATAPRQLGHDVYVTAASMPAARRAAGGAIAAVEAVLAGRRAWSLCRPPGHHATPTAAMGFCLLSNAAIAARCAQAEHGVAKVAIVDWDVHHGNGTQDVFYEDPSVLTISLHELQLYPGTGAADERGAGAGRGACLNVPVAGRTGPERYLELFDDAVPGAIAAFAPDLVIVSCGFDAHVDDPLATLELEAGTFAALVTRVRDLCRELAIPEPALVQEGGYDLPALCDCATAVIEAYWTDTSRG